MKTNYNKCAVTVLRNALGDCSNHGVTSAHCSLTLWEKGTPNEYIERYCSVEASRKLASYIDEFPHKHESYYNTKYVEYLNDVKERQLRVEIIYTPYAEVVFKSPCRLYMASGNYVCNGHSGDWEEIAMGEQAIRVHDRTETREVYNGLSV